jgi:hypothetical protein
MSRIWPIEAAPSTNAVQRRGLQQLPAVEDRLGIDARSAAAGGPDLEAQVR